ncbi:MAG: type II restriction endonuclease [Nitrospinota bacterium]|nr:type II restriction endonuclease [Nitrospinota bacterium]
MALADLADWMDECAAPHFIWYVKRLSGNDTLANGSHQAGPYIPKEFLFRIFPSLDRKEIKNPEVRLNLKIDSHSDKRQIRIVWYNNKFHDNPKGGRNESRLTNLGGISSALLDPDNTGALAIFAFVLDKQGRGQACHVWVCRSELEEDLVENLVGSVEPGKWLVWSVDEAGHPDLFPLKEKSRLSCWLDPDEMPPEWLIRFPTGAEIVAKTLKLRPAQEMNPDKRLMKRRACEFEIFRSVEEAVELPWIEKGFGTIDEFVARAQTVLQRRKSRSGRSLELHAKEIFIEEEMREGHDFDHQPESELGKKPDFLFPSELAYKNRDFPDTNLRMLAVKTTCKDRWRQILNEADRIQTKHLLTLQEGVSEGQFQEMSKEKVKLVVPKPLLSSYSKSIQPHLLTLEKFIGNLKTLGKLK